MKIRFEPRSGVSEETLRAHRAYSRSLGLPEIVPGKVGAAAPFLAVVGGSPDVVDHIDTLRDWDGDVWAVNGTWQWCHDNGIDAALYTIDAVFDPKFLGDVRRAVLADVVKPSVFDGLRHADVELVRLGADSILPATTSAATAPLFACWRGHRHVTFFGCASCYGKTTHAYRSETANLIWVSCGGRDFVTSPQMIMQAEFIADMARQFPDYVTVVGDGFLPALIKHGDYDVTHVCRAIHEVVS